MVDSKIIRDYAYHEIAERLPHKRRRVYNIVIQMHPCTNAEIGKRLEIPINEVTGRVSELKRSFLIRECGMRKGDRSINHTLWEPVKSWNERKELIRKEIERQELILKDYQNIKAWDLGYCKDVKTEISKGILKAVNTIKELKKYLQR